MSLLWVETAKVRRYEYGGIMLLSMLEINGRAGM